MGYELIDTPEADPRNARFLATACDLAYLPEAEGAAAFRDRLGLEARLVSVDNTQVYVGGNDRVVVAAFRGSESPATLDGFKDWLLTNANNFLVLPEGRLGTDFAAAGVGARFHRGFLEGLAMVWDPFYAAVEAEMKQAERPLWLTGHSLGGGLALLAAWRLQQNFVPVHRVYTFGAPMVGNAAAAEAFARELPGKIFRYVDARDLVPLLPTVSLVANAYGHCLTEMVLGDEAEGSAAGILRQLAAGAVPGLLTAALMDSLWDSLRQRIDAHLMANYQALIAARCPD